MRSDDLRIVRASFPAVGVVDRNDSKELGFGKDKVLHQAINQETI